MRKVLIVSALLLLATPFPTTAQQAVPFRGDRQVTVMTRNLYLGAGLSGPLMAGSPAEFVAAVTQTFANVQLTNFPERAEALADEIQATRPDLIGLQEVVSWRSQFPADLNPSPNATTIEFDFLQLLLDALSARGLHYTAVARSTGFDFEAPRLVWTTSGPDLEDIRLTDSEVILARADLKVADLKLSNITEGHFATNVVVNILDTPVTIRRGWASVDAKIRGKTFRFITTHLEPEDFAPSSNAVQVAQAEELLQGPANTTLPVVLLGDFNSKADGTGTATYGKLLAAGFVDAWDVAHPGDPGFTCCQKELLDNPISALSQRIDLVLFRGGFGVRNADIVGEEAGDLTASGLWPSDHAGVVARLRLPRR